MKQIADLYPSATVMFADIVGFTAWSSVREPSQVFKLLETLYRAFDKLAKRRRVFKVETIGDCYVAACGLPTARKDHAVVMARFARECLDKIASLTKNLEMTLGPDTSDLSMRIGLHSGQVTAGVLRGDRARFQLFGETVNTASLMESSGERGQIQISEATSELLQEAGKSTWFKPREDSGLDFPSFWLRTRSSKSDNSGSVSSGDRTSSQGSYDKVEGSPSVKDCAIKEAQALVAKNRRLVIWTGEVLLQLLKQIVARRTKIGTITSLSDTDQQEQSFSPKTSELHDEGDTTIDEVVEIIELPEFDEKVSHHEVDLRLIEIEDVVLEQLNDYIETITSLYRENHFHNFEHASHVTMSVSKLLSRIVAPDAILLQQENEGSKLASNLHDHTYGITSDPLTQFACVFAALIHDVDHQGVPNAQLCKEEAEVAIKYKHKSVAE
jgi:class 3 adenylate cyclase